VSLEESFVEHTILGVSPRLSATSGDARGQRATSPSRTPPPPLRGGRVPTDRGYRCSSIACRSVKPGCPRRTQGHRDFLAVRSPRLTSSSEPYGSRSATRPGRGRAVSCLVHCRRWRQVDLSLLHTLVLVVAHHRQPPVEHSRSTSLPEERGKTSAALRARVNDRVAAQAASTDNPGALADSSTRSRRRCWANATAIVSHAWKPRSAPGRTFVLGRKPANSRAGPARFPHDSTVLESL